MRGVDDAREGVRKAQAATDYEAAREAPERAGIDRTVTVERPGEPLLQTLDGPGHRPKFAAPADGGQPRSPRSPPSASRRRRGIPAPFALALHRREWRDRARAGRCQGGRRRSLEAAGIGPLVHQDGKSIDGSWREKLIEEGYLPPDSDGGLSRHDPPRVSVSSRAARAGVYPYDWAGSDERSGFSRAKDEHAAASSRSLSDVRSALADVGVDPKTIHKDVLDRAAAALMRGEASDPLNAVEDIVRSAKEPPSRQPRAWYRRR